MNETISDCATRTLAGNLFVCVQDECDGTHHVYAKR